MCQSTSGISPGALNMYSHQSFLANALFWKIHANMNFLWEAIYKLTSLPVILLKEAMHWLIEKGQGWRHQRALCQNDSMLWGFLKLAKIVIIDSASETLLTI